MLRPNASRTRVCETALRDSEHVTRYPDVVKTKPPKIFLPAWVQTTDVVQFNNAYLFSERCMFFDASSHIAFTNFVLHEKVNRRLLPVQITSGIEILFVSPSHAITACEREQDENNFFYNQFQWVVKCEMLSTLCMKGGLSIVFLMSGRCTFNGL